jgi:Trehalose utilisation
MRILLALLILLSGLHSANAQAKRIVLVAGETAKVDTVGHHDYIAGCKCLEHLLTMTPNVQTSLVLEGWPTDAAVFDGAAAIVFYTDGGGKQAFLDSSERITKMQQLVDGKVGLVMIHQAVDYPVEHAEKATKWLGGVYVAGKSGRGHWPSRHVDFPAHAVTRGVVPWEINDGWLNQLQFVEGMKGITPLVWSGKKYEGSRAGLDSDIVGFAYDRPAGGRSFSFTGLDAHSAWSLPGMRRLVVNGILWSANIEVPADGAICEIDQVKLDSFLTPRQPKPKPQPKSKQS